MIVTSAVGRGENRRNRFGLVQDRSASWKRDSSTRRQTAQNGLQTPLKEAQSRRYAASGPYAQRSATVLTSPAAPSLVSCSGLPASGRAARRPERRELTSSRWWDHPRTPASARCQPGKRYPDGDHFSGPMPACLMTRLQISTSALRNAPTLSGVSGRLS